MLPLGGPRVARAEEDGLPAGLPPLPGAPEPAPQPEPQPAAAPDQDVVVLNNGSRWRGRVVRDDAEGVVLETTSASGAVRTMRIARSDLAAVERATRRQEAPSGTQLVRDEWFLLHAEGKVVGWRHLSVARIQASELRGWRMEEEVFEFGKGRHLPPTRTRLVETATERFEPRLIVFSETTEAQDQFDGTQRKVSGQVQDGVWRVASTRGGKTSGREVAVPRGARGPLAAREGVLRRRPRKIGLETVALIDPHQERVVDAQVGFVSVGGRGDLGDELHWVREGQRRVAHYGSNFRTLREELAEGLVATPSTERRCLAAEANPNGDPAAPRAEAAITQAPGEGLTVRLPRAGLAFRRPDSTWQWSANLKGGGSGSWHALGLLRSSLQLSDVRMEWHPGPLDEREGRRSVGRWLYGHLKRVAPDVQFLRSQGAVSVPGAYRFDLRATVRGERLRTVAMIVERTGGFVVVLCACPERTWASDRVALEDLLASLRLF